MSDTPSSGRTTPESDEGRNTSAPGDGLVRAGAIVFAVGALATLVTVAPLLLGMARLPAPAYFVCMLMGVGFALATAGVLRSVAAQRRQAEAGAAGGAAGG